MASPGVKSSASTVPNAGLFIQRENKAPSFSDTGFLHAWSPIKWGGRGLWPSVPALKHTRTGVDFAAGFPLSLSPRGCTVLLPARDQQWEDAVGAA